MIHVTMVTPVGRDEITEGEEQRQSIGFKKEEKHLLASSGRFTHSSLHFAMLRYGIVMIWLLVKSVRCIKTAVMFTIAHLLPFEMQVDS